METFAHWWAVNLSITSFIFILSFQFFAVIPFRSSLNHVGVSYGYSSGVFWAFMSISSSDSPMKGKN